MLNNLPNFENLIATGKVITLPSNSDLLTMGVRDPRFEGGYQPVAIKFQDFAAGIMPPIPSIFDDEGNVFIGENAFNDITSVNKQSNIAIGKNTLNFVTESGNVAIGEETLKNTSTGFSNIGIGSGSLYFNVTGENNVALGSAPMLFNTTGKNNIAIGTISLFSNTTGRDNIAIGINCLGGNTTGQNNCALGSEIDNNNFSNCVLLGRQATATGSNQFVVGSVGYNAGTVTNAAASQTHYWNVRINGTAYKILLST